MSGDTPFDPSDPNQLSNDKMLRSVELTPQQAAVVPVKRTVRRRAKYLGAAVTVGRAGHIVVYMAADERLDYCHKPIFAKN